MSDKTFLAKQLRRVSIVGLKQFAVTRLPKGSALRELLLSERDELAAEEFLAKMDVWLKLLRQLP